uniref:ORF YJR83.28 protein n=1 Tax=Saccharomyces cerevisiae TaxID=4932 RepID=E9PA82_YEASX|nr:ORF YJR83.28 [Saccharomyces cerevisiae]
MFFTLGVQLVTVLLKVIIWVCIVQTDISWVVLRRLITTVPITMSIWIVLQFRFIHPMILMIGGSRKVTMIPMLTSLVLVVICGLHLTKNYMMGKCYGLMHYNLYPLM